MPASPVPASMTNGSALIEVELVPIAHSNGLRLTVLPVLASESDPAMESEDQYPLLVQDSLPLESEYRAMGSSSEEADRA
eukprot:SAG22_NODE_1_length_62449_cov_158.689270_6_plen_80_part_00